MTFSGSMQQQLNEPKIPGQSENPYCRRWNWNSISLLCVRKSIYPTTKTEFIPDSMKAKEFPELIFELRTLCFRQLRCNSIVGPTVQYHQNCYSKICPIQTNLFHTNESNSQNELHFNRKSALHHDHQKFIIHIFIGCQSFFLWKSSVVTLDYTKWFGSKNFDASGLG